MILKSTSNSTYNMEALKSKQEATFKNKVIYLLILALAGVSGYSLWKINTLVDQYTNLAYVISPEMTYIGKVQRGYTVSEVELRAHARLFYSTMFSFTADNYKENVTFAKDNLVDYQTGLYIESNFTDPEVDLYNQLLRTNGEMVTLLDSISPPDLRKEPIEITAYCRQYLVSGEEKSEQSFVNTYQVYYSGIARTDDNPFGLQIRNWKNIKVD